MEEDGREIKIMEFMIPQEMEKKEVDGFYIFIG